MRLYERNVSVSTYHAFMTGTPSRDDQYHDDDRSPEEPPDAFAKIPVKLFGHALLEHIDDSLYVLVTKHSSWFRHGLPLHVGVRHHNSIYILRKAG